MALIFSTVPTARLHKTFKRNLFFSCPGLLIIGLSSIGKIPSSFCFFIGIFIVFKSFQPYRLIRRLELYPHILNVDEDFWCFHYHKKPLFKIRTLGIKNLVYQERDRDYGVLLQLENKTDLTLLTKKQGSVSLVKSLIKINENEKDIAVFLPYFSQGTSIRLKEYLTSSDSKAHEIVHTQ